MRSTKEFATKIEPTDREEIRPADEVTRGLIHTTIVPNSIIEHRFLSTSEKIVWIDLFKYCFHGNTSYPSQKRRARELGMSSRQLRTLERGLEDRGLIRIEHRPGTSNIYHLFAPLSER